MKHFSISEITAIVKGEWAKSNQNDSMINHLLTDSRRLGVISECMFIALKSSKNDGHRYVKDLYNKGIRNFMLEVIPDEIQNIEDVNVILVKDTLRALQKMAAEYRSRFDIPVVGITGSNGKTIVKEWLSMLLEEDKHVVKSPKSYNSQVGVPLSVWEMQPENDIALFEAGISEPNEMDYLQAIIKPTIGIFTNIGSMHDEYFLNRTQKIAEKLKLFVKVDLLIYCGDHNEIRERVHNLESFRDVKQFCWGSKFAEADLLIEKMDIRDFETIVTAKYQQEILELSIPFIDHASIENVMHCWAFMLTQGYRHEVIAQRIAKLEAIEMRMNLKEGINNCVIINDSYTSDFNSLQIAIDFLNQQPQAMKTVILSDIVQSGRNENELYQDIADLLVQKNVQRLIGIGPSISRQVQAFPMEKQFFPDTDTFLKEFHFSDFQKEAILLKGARMFRFEKINKALQHKTHETVLEVNLNALQHNLNYFRSHLKPETKMMAMVKAFSYGSGSFEIANWLQFHQIDYLTVAFSDEGIELRKAGIELPMMVMNPEEQNMDALFKYHLEPEIFNFRILASLKEELQANPLQEIAIHIKLDTGMHRLGFDETDIDALIVELKSCNRIQVKSVFSHLSASDNPTFDDFTKQQIASFERMSDKIQKAFGTQVIRHILNSSGISRFAGAQFDMVRLGIGLYGIGANEHEQSKLMQSGRLRTVISQIKTIPEGDSVGYNRAFIAKRKTRVGVLPIGYADGFDRRLSNGVGRVWINGQIAHIIGNVCMDMCMVDLTDIQAEEDDEVIIFGEEFPIQEMSKDMNTIPYEILTGISQRVKRVYYQE